MITLAAAATPAHTRARSHPGEWAMGAGLVLVVVGTFLPWLHSGSVDRNSYSTVGVLRRLVGTSGALERVLPVWPFVALACAIAVALLLLRLVAIGAAVTALAAVVAGVGGIVALNTSAVGTVGVAGLGPGVTIAGAATALLGILIRTIPLDRITRSTR